MTGVNAPSATSSSPETSSGSPGTILRRCREFHEITLEEASETTKIGVSHLKALEDDQIHEFANQAYLKGFLRIYATYLGLNSDDIARMYDKIFGIQGEKADAARTSLTPNRPPQRLISLKKMLFPALLLVVILFTATFYKRSEPPIVHKQQPVMAVVQPQQNPAIQMAQSSARAKKPEPTRPVPRSETVPAETIDADTTATAKQPADTAKVFILKIRVTQSGTLAATVDGSAPQQYELAVGDIIAWKAEKKITLDLSNAGGVEIELNGSPYKSLGPPGKPAYIELDINSVKQ